MYVINFVNISVCRFVCVYENAYYFHLQCVFIRNVSNRGTKKAQSKKKTKKANISTVRDNDYNCN